MVYLVDYSKSNVLRFFLCSSFFSFVFASFFSPFFLSFDAFFLFIGSTADTPIASAKRPKRRAQPLSCELRYGVGYRLVSRQVVKFFVGDHVREGGARGYIAVV